MVSPIFSNLRLNLRTNPSLWIGVALLLLASVAGLCFIFWGSFMDEGAILASGLFMSQGYRLYGDIFSQQFPLAYYWAAVVVAVFGRSLLAARLSLLVFRLLVAVVLMRLTHWYVPVGLAALAWSLIGPFYFGQMFIYYAISGVCLNAIFVLVLGLLTDRTPDSRGAALTLGVLSAAGFLADPQTVFGAGLACLALALRRRWRTALFVPLLSGLAVAAVLLGFWLNGSLAEFYDGAIRLNLDVYPRYCCAGGLTPIQLLQTALSGLYNSNAPWMQDGTNFPYNQVTGAYTLVDTWVATGLLSRVCIIAACAVLALRRKLLAAAFVYGFALILLYRSEMFFRAIPFALVSFSVAGLLAAGLDGERAAAAQPQRQRVPAARSLLVWGARGAGALLLAWVCFRGAGYIATHPEQLTYAANFKYYDDIAADIQKHACQQPNVTLAYYPYDPFLYFASGMRPASRFLFVLPWFTRYQPEIVAQLMARKAIVYFDPKRSIWGVKDINYASDLYQYLKTDYVERPGDFFLSSDLARDCLPV